MLNYYLMHPADMVPQELTTRIELYRRHDDLFVSELSGLTIELPDAEATETVFGMNSLLFTDRLTMGCEEVRAELTIEQCQPGPCPVIDTQPARNLIPVRILSP
ncbi:MAG: hypothetical protein U5Q16_13450 [Gammaproteobacteria bacterium]|nr:hypothetical protein [Gammaproteobacteria bacterium]